MTTPQNPSSAKECALCHYRWVDTFFLHERGSELVPYQSEKVVATIEMCFSCHDGSVADSRLRVFNGRHHPINKPPPATMQIPEGFPLDKEGNMQCATCHTAHGVPSDMGMEKTIFLRTSNEDSAMCRLCHIDKAGGSAAGNHPIDSTAIDFTEELLESGAAQGTMDNQVICESCHMVHGAPGESFLIDSPDEGSNLCLKCHHDKKEIIGSMHDLRFSAPTSTNISNKNAANSGACGACHQIHGSKALMLWARSLPNESSGNKNIDLCLSCHQQSLTAEKSILNGYSHPYNIHVKGPAVNTKLPFYSPLGIKVSQQHGVLTCTTCHDPHKGRSLFSDDSSDTINTFLRYPIFPSPELCRQCHTRESLIEATDHDLRLTIPNFENSKGQTPSESGVCGVCHLMHNASNEKLWALADFDELPHSAPKICIRCHSPEGPAENKQVGKRTHPMNISPGDFRISTSLPLTSANDNHHIKELMTCLTCHNPHQWDPNSEIVDHSFGREGDGSNSFLRRPSAPAPELCADCHKSQSLVWKTDHDMNITAPSSTNLLGQTPAESGTCGTCHLVHNGKIRFHLWARKLRRGNGVMDKMCKSCHRKKGIAENKVPKTDSHPDGMLITNVGRDDPDAVNYFPLFHKNTGAKVRVGDISCASCHNVHQWDPLVHQTGWGKNLEGRTTDSFLRRQTYSIMCIDCHGLDALFRFKYYHNTRQRGAAVN